MNELVVRGRPGRVRCKFPSSASARFHGKQSWYGPIGGLRQSVYLEAPPPHIRVKYARCTERAGARYGVPEPAGRQCAESTLKLTDPNGRYQPGARSRGRGADPVRWQSARSCGMLAAESVFA